MFVDGTLNTGDLAYADATGRIHIAGRAKDLIIRSGHNIDPLMIENAMQRHPAVALAAAVGMPDAYAGEVPVCYVALRPDAVVTEAELREHAEQAIAERPAWPRQIHIISAIPVTSVGKIYKPQLRCDAATRLVQQIVHGKLSLPEAKRAGCRGRDSRNEDHRRAARRTTCSAVPLVQRALGAHLFEVEVVFAAGVTGRLVACRARRLRMPVRKSWPGEASELQGKLSLRRRHLRRRGRNRERDGMQLFHVLTAWFVALVRDSGQFRLLHPSAPRAPIPSTST